MRGRIIVIGASAGGISAITHVLRMLPATFAAPVFVVQHVGPESPGYLPTMLARVTTLPIMHPRDGQRIEPGHVYVAPPDRHMLVRSGWIHLSKGPKEQYSRPAVDVLFRSAAVSHGPATVGVVLTGNLTDGTVGLLAIKDFGGVSIVQDPAEALAPSMPHSALAKVPIDYVRGIHDIAALLVQLVADATVARPPVVRSTTIEDRIAADEASSRDIADLLSRGTLTTNACPCCAAALYKLDERRVSRYRCAAGHAFTEASLADIATVRSATT